MTKGEPVFGYLALSVISPVLVLLIADLRQLSKAVRH
jgi:hypothetical protein